MDETEVRILGLPAVKRVLELVGLTAILWNQVELLWYLIYTCLLHELPRQKIDRIYQNFPTITAKLDFTLSLADLAFVETPELIEFIKTLSGNTKQLAGLRNAIVHADYQFDFLNGPPGLRIRPSGDYRKKPNQYAVAGADLAKQIEEVTEKISAHIDELSEFRIYLIQNFLPEGKRAIPLPKHVLDRMPDFIRNALPREHREKAALRTIPKKAGKQRHRPKQ